MDNKDDISIEDFKIMSKKIKDTGINEIDILGGEPTLHKDLIRIIEIGKEYFDSIYLSSNETDPLILEVLSQYKPVLKIGISVNRDYKNNGEHGWNEKLLSVIIDNGFLVKSIANRRGFLHEDANLFIKNSIPFYLIYMDPISESDLNVCMPFYEFYSGFYKLKRTYNNIYPVFCGGFISDSEVNWRCPAGSDKISIMPDGSVYPCYLFFRFPEFKLGNLIKDNLDKILGNPLLRFFKKFQKNTCPQLACPIHNRCRGGCPAISYIFYGKVNRPDPRCSIV